MNYTTIDEKTNNCCGSAGDRADDASMDGVAPKNTIGHSERRIKRSIMLPQLPIWPASCISTHGGGANNTDETSTLTELYRDLESRAVQVLVENGPGISGWQPSLSYAKVKRVAQYLPHGCVTNLSFEACVGGVSWSFKYTPVLNGANGEVTGTDDLDSNEDRKRAHREARNKMLHSSTTQHKSSDALARIASRKRRELRDKEQTLKAQVELLSEGAVVEETLDQAYERIITRGLIKLTYGGVDCYVESSGKEFKLIADLPEDCDTLVPGTHAHFRIGKDYLSFVKSPEEHIVPSLIFNRSISSFEYLDDLGAQRFHNVCEYVIFSPLLKTLEYHWQKPILTLSVENAINNYMVKLKFEVFRCVGLEVVTSLTPLFDSTLGFFLNYLRGSRCGAVLADVKSSPLKNSFLPYREAMYNKDTVIQTHDFIKVSPSPRILPLVASNEGLSLGLAIKPNIGISTGGDPVSFNTADEFVRSVLPTYHRDELIEGQLNSRKYVSVGMDLIPCCWDRSDPTDTMSFKHAIAKRLMGAREGERELWLNQQRWNANLDEYWEGARPLHTHTPDYLTNTALLNYGLTGQKIVTSFDKKCYPQPIPLSDDLGTSRYHEYTKYYYTLDPYFRNVAPIRGYDNSTVMEVANCIIDSTKRGIFSRISDFFQSVDLQMREGAFSQYAYLFSLGDNREKYAYMESAKRAQRIRVLNTVKYSPMRVICECQAYLKDELDKLNPAKPSRIFVSYGEQSSFLAPHVITVAKKKLQGRRVFIKDRQNGPPLTCTLIVHTTPTVDDIDSSFKELLAVRDTPNSIVYVCFSDDAVIAWNVDGKFGYANVDITSCDSSNGPLIFNIVRRMLANLDTEAAYEYLLQCRQPIMCRNPQLRSEFFKILFPTCFEGSGTSLTTLLNCIANMLIFAGIIDVLTRTFCVNFSDVIREGAASVGHKVTVDLCVDGYDRPVFEKVQFLKYSPIWGQSDGQSRYYPSRNLGTLCRGLGKINEDLSPQQVAMSPAEWRHSSKATIFDKYISGVVRGWKHEPSHPFLTGLRHRFCANSNDFVVKVPTVVENTTTFGDVVLDVNSLARRYDVLTSDLADLFSTVQVLKLGSIIDSRVLRRAMEVDYGLSPREVSPTMYSYVHTGVTFTTL